MHTCLIYPPALCDFELSASKKMFRVVPVTVSKLSDKRITGAHWHDYLQIWYTVSGSYLHTADGITYEQKPGSAMLIFPYMKHCVDSSKSNLSETTVIQISVKKHALEKNSVPFLPHTYHSASFDSIDLKLHTLFSGEDKQAADRICMELLSEYDKHVSMHFPKVYSLIADFLKLCANHSEKRYSNREIITAQNRNAAIDKALAFLMDNSKNKITLIDASNAAMMSKTVFIESFQAVTGQSCHSYINVLRMHNAVNFLLSSEKSISEIALECGFYDSSHFRRQCVEFYGVPPLRLRRELNQWAQDHGDDPV